MCPSGPTFVIGLGPTNPWLIIIAKETLVFRRAGLSPALRLLVPTFSLRIRSTVPHDTWLHCGMGRSPTTLFFEKINNIRIFGTTLSPDHLRRKLSE
jgi:hypothetical protein